SAAESVFASPGSAPAGTEKAASTADSMTAGLTLVALTEGEDFQPVQLPPVQFIVRASTASPPR
ncbi:hypothetical protein AB0J18_21230, partial [Streptomyces sp. NPDC049916]